MKTVENSNELKQIENSLEQFRELKKNLDPNASAEQKRHLDELISMGETSLSMLGRESKTEVPTSPFSLSWRRIRETLILFTVVAIVMFVLFFVAGAFQRPL